MSRLAELVLCLAQQTVCACGNERHGVAYACYRLPGTVLYITAVTKLHERASQVSFHATDGLPGENRARFLQRLNASELHLARALGAPASWRGAWTQAIFEAQITATEVLFPVGAGVRCTVTQHAYDQDSLVHLEAEEGPSHWLSHRDYVSLRAGELFCLFALDRDLLLQQLQVEAGRLLLNYESSGMDLQLALPGGHFVLPLAGEKTVYTAAAAGRSVLLQVRQQLVLIAQQLQSRERGLKTISDKLAPRKVFVVNREQALLLLQSSDADIRIVLDDFCAASSTVQRRMLSTWKNS